VGATSSDKEPVLARSSQPVDSGISNEEGILKVDDQRSVSSTETHFELCTASMFSFSVFSPMELKLLITDPLRRSTRIKEMAGLMRGLISMGECQLGMPAECEAITTLLERICDEDLPMLSKRTRSPHAPIKFKDAVGRKFSFPWDLCKTWKVSLSTFGLWRA
jgi:hypothetical protein